MSQETPAHVQKALVFFQQPVWSRLLEALYTKFIERGRIGGQVLLQGCTPEEQREIARFLGRPLSTSSDITIRLADFQQALNDSGFACDLPTLLRARFPELSHLTRPQQKEHRAQRQQHFSEQIEALIERLPTSSMGSVWLLQGKHGRDTQLRRYKNEDQATQQQLLHTLQIVTEALDHLPLPPQFQSLSHFALQRAGDPHFFDANTSGGRLFLSALMDLHDLHAFNTTRGQSEAPVVEQGYWRHLLYYEAGLLLDAISSTVAVFRLQSARHHNGEADALITHAGSRVLVLPLRQLLDWKELLPCSKHVYLFENPQVFEVIINNLLQMYPTATLPTLVCTSGWPSVAAIRCLHLLIQAAPDMHLHYSGDFDLQGLQIAHYLLTSYPQQCQLWHFDPTSYQTALHDRSAALEANELAGLAHLPAVFASLVATMQQERRKAYQEGITHLLLEDIKSVYTSNI
jgi:uncharacterized protein (TIGR02679 family)